MLGLALAACALSLPMSPRARLRVEARGSVPFDEIQSQIQEVTDALARLTARNTCSDENGCLSVEITWSPAEEEDCATTMRMSLLMAPPAPVKNIRKTILSDRVETARTTNLAHDAIERVLRDK